MKLAPIPGFDGYFVTVDGEVYSDMVKKKAPGQHTGTVSATDPARRHVLRPTLRSGYLAVRLYQNTKMRHLSVHRAVMLAWGPPAPFVGALVRHLDGNPLHNSIDNLAWGTVKDNSADDARLGRGPVGVRNPRSKLTEADVLHIRSAMADGIRTRKTAPALARKYNVTDVQIYDIASRKSWRHL